MQILLVRCNCFLAKQHKPSVDRSTQSIAVLFDLYDGVSPRLAPPGAFAVLALSNWQYASMRHAGTLWVRVIGDLGEDEVTGRGDSNPWVRDDWPWVTQ